MICGASICTDYCPSPNAYFHGSRCRCDRCQHFICEAHALQHSKQDHKQADGSSCFPALARLATGAVEVCTKVFLFNAGTGESDPRPESSEKLSRFLNVLTPGWLALGKAVERLPDDHYETRQWPAPVRAEYIYLQPDFFSEAMIDRVFALALRSVGRATAAAPVEMEMSVPDLTPGQVMSMKDLAMWATGQSRKLSDDVLLAWTQGDRRLDARKEDIILSYVRRAASLELPSDPSEVVDWLVSAPVREYA
jgi:hypothetical protein